MLKAAIPGVTATNWTSVRDYILYGPQRPPPGPGGLFCGLAQWACLPKAIHSIRRPSKSNTAFMLDTYNSGILHSCSAMDQKAAHGAAVRSDCLGAGIARTLTTLRDKDAEFRLETSR